MIRGRDFQFASKGILIDASCSCRRLICQPWPSTTLSTDRTSSVVFCCDRSATRDSIVFSKTDIFASFVCLHRVQLPILSHFCLGLPQLGAAKRESEILPGILLKGFRCQSALALGDPYSFVLLAFLHLPSIAWIVV